LIFKWYNLYSWGDDFKIRNLTKSRLRGWHINPYVRTVACIINDNSIVDKKYCYSNSKDESPLWLENDTKLYCENEGWKIEFPKHFEPPKELSKEFSIKNSFLEPSERYDMIEIAVNFAKRIDNLTQQTSSKK